MSLPPLSSRCLVTLLVLGSAAWPSFAKPTDDMTEDPYLWLEAVESPRALDWVENRNRLALDELTSQDRYTTIRDGLLEIYNSSDKIPHVTKHGDFYYNFWQDADHVRGIWRRCLPPSYTLAEPDWETVLDLDLLATAEGESWVWKGAAVLDLTHDRALVRLSRGGKDAVTVREFDLTSLNFVEDGFLIPESRNTVAWLDRNTLIFGTADTPENATESGYPLKTFRWHRGTPISAARLLHAGNKTDVGVFGSVSDSASNRRTLITISATFFERAYFLVQPDDSLIQIEVPAKSNIGLFHDQLIISLQSDWSLENETHSAGALVAIKLDDFLTGDRQFQTLFSPEPRVSLDTYTFTQNYVVINTLDNVNNRVFAMHHTAGAWTRTEVATPPIGQVSVSAIDSDHSDDLFLTTSNFLEPSTLHAQTLGQDNRTVLKRTPTYFDASSLVMTQHEATAPDGTRVPYFQVAPAGMILDGSNPTLLYGYGGFQISMKPEYTGTWGRSWMARGGVFILANIRGGGEFGPAWHQAALKGNRQVSWDDFIAIGEDLVERGVTSPPHLGIMGGSQGGLLMGVMYTQRPDLWGAVVCQVPLLDMLRYHKLLAGASWVGEYGNPDIPEERAFIEAYSPYQNVVADRHYPRILFVTSTRDDRVHPGHARKMAARLEQQGHDFLYWENTEGGHGGASNNDQRATLHALGYTFLWQELSSVED